MDYKMTIEVRPRLRACQFYITKKQLSLKELKIFKNSVVLFVGGSKAVFELDEMNLIPESMSGLSLGNNSLCFRCQFEPSKMYGSVKTEILPINKLQVSSKAYIPPIEKDSSYNMFCNCCLNQLTENEITFTRILPLPTGNFDSVDLFCHGASKGVFNTQPRKNDCLYGNSFFKIDSSLINCEGNIMHCKRCLSWLGTRDSTSVILWNSTVRFNKESVFDVENVPLLDFISVMKNILSEGSGDFCKILIYSKISENDTHYLLLWVLEGNLELLVSPETSSDLVKLKKKNVMKVLYRFEKECSKEMELSEKDLYINKVEVSKQMMVEGLKHMKKMSTFISDEYKTTNNMFVSYIEDVSDN